MTGFGEARRHVNGVAVAAEVRTINSRYFKLALKCGEGYTSLEPEIEQLVRQRIRRGTVQVTLRVDRPPSAEMFRLNTAALAAYREQLNELYREWGQSHEVSLAALLALPGVVVESTAATSDAAEDWLLIRETLEAAMDRLAQMRADEGRALAADLKANSMTVADELRGIGQRAPRVVEAYRARLAERLQSILAEHSVAIDPADVLKEVSIFAERSDISEEVVRLASHLQQFDSITELPEGSGRKLEFLTQEMFREANTIGAKANDVEIARHVIEIKAAIERIREMIQNVE